MYRIAPAPICCLSLLLTLSPAQGPAMVRAGSSPAAASARVDRVRAYLESQRQQRGFPGASVGWVLPGGQCEAVAVGLADRAAKRLLTVRDRMLSGSIGKTYVVTVALQLVTEERLGLDDKVAVHLGKQAWFGRLPNAADLTVRSLMNHTSGIRRHVFAPAFQALVKGQPDKRWRPDELLSYVFDTEPLFAVGKGWAYADTNYIVLGLVIEKITGRPFNESMHRRVLHRFDLKDTLPSDRRYLPGLAQGYSESGAAFGVVDKTLEDGVMVINPQFEWCGGGLCSTTADLARWAAIFGAGRHWSKELRVQIRQGVAAPMLGRGASYGLGTMIASGKHGAWYGHAGFMPGYMSAMRYYADADLAVAIQFNTDHRRQLGRRPGSYLDAIVDLLAAESAGKPRDRRGK